MRILYVDIDSQRPDHLGCYGYHRNTSPAIDQIAREGVVFRSCYTSDAPCLPSRTALYSGRFGIQSGVVGHGGVAAQPKIQINRGFRDWFDEQGLARQLQKLGFHTAMISPFGQRHAAHWFYAGFSEIHNTGLGGMESAEHVMPVLDDWLERNLRRDNWYLHVNFWDPHTPYRVPMSFGEPFVDQPLPPHLADEKLIERHMKKTGPHSALDLGMYRDGHDPKFPRTVNRITGVKSMKQWIDGYDTAIRYVDHQLGQVFRRLREAGVYDETAIIISADHGENQGELGIYGEHGTADRGTCHIPMIIKWPHAARGATCDSLVYNVDLAFTLTELLGGKPCEIWDGQSFAQAVRNGGPVPGGRDELVLSQCAHVCQRSVRWDRWLYMRTYHDGFHLFPQEMLFDLHSDPFEQDDLASRRPDLCREGNWRLSRWHDRQMHKMTKYCGDSVDPMWSVIRDGGPLHASLSPIGQPGVAGLKDYIARLEQTGRADGAEKLRRRLPQ